MPYTDPMGKDPAMSSGRAPANYEWNPIIACYGVFLKCHGHSIHGTIVLYLPTLTYISPIKINLPCMYNRPWAMYCFIGAIRIGECQTQGLVWRFPDSITIFCSTGLARGRVVCHSTTI